MNSQKTTYDPDFEKTFQVKHISKGDLTNYPTQGDRVSVHYVGTFPTNGKEFDSSVRRNSPFQFILYAGQVIKC